MSIVKGRGLVIDHPSYSETTKEETHGEWKVVEEFPDYEITRYGVMRNIKTGRIRKSYEKADGLLSVVLRKGGKTYCRSVPKLTRIAWGYYLGR